MKPQSPNISSTSGSRWTTVYGWVFVLAGLYLLVAGLGSLLTGQGLTPPPSPFGHSSPISALSALFQAALFAATGLAIIRRHKVAVTLVWVSVGLSGLGVLIRGLIPLDTLLWLVGLGLAIWYSKRRSPRATPPGAASVTVPAKQPTPKEVSASAEPPRQVHPGEAFPAPQTKTTLRLEKLDRLLQQPEVLVGLVVVLSSVALVLSSRQEQNGRSTEKIEFVPDCPDGVPAGVPIVSIADLTGITGSDAKLKWFDYGYMGNPDYDGWHLSFKVLNHTGDIEPKKSQFGGYCLTGLQYEVKMQSDNGRLWNATGKKTLDKPLPPQDLQQLGPLNLIPHGQPRDAALVSWSITKAWGFPWDGLQRSSGPLF